MISACPIYARIAIFLMAAHAMGASAVNPVRLMVDLSPTPDAVMLSAFDLCIVDAAAKVDLEDQQTLGNKMLARMNVFEVEEHSVAAGAAQSVGVPLLEATRQGFVRLDATHPNWVPLVVHRIVQAAAERGFDGFVLTGLETVSHDAERAACLQALAQLDKAYPDKQLVIEDALDLVPEAHRYLEGVLMLDSNETAPRREQRIREVKRLGVSPLVVEYIPADLSQSEMVQRTQRYRSMGAVPFFTTPSLNGTHLGPLQEVTRRIMVIHSGSARETFAAKVFQGSLEWLG